MTKTPYNYTLAFVLHGLIGLGAPAQADERESADSDARRMPMELPKVEVFGMTPLPSSGQPINDVPGNLQLARDKDLERQESLDLSDYLRRDLGNVFANETLANPFQPDISYRGFSASPVLGTPVGLSVYQDGVRINEPFGDVVNWDLVPKVAISSIELVPGSNPLFGLNTLGGALAVRTKSGVSHPGTRVQAYGGSFARWNVEAEHGGSVDNFDWFIAGNFFREDGFRDYSPSSVNQVFAKLGWENGSTDIDLTYTHAENKLTGNGVAPESLLATDRSAVYAHPEVTRPDLNMFNLTLIHDFSASWKVSGNAYYRYSKTRVYAGDIELEPKDEEDFVTDPVLNSTQTRQDGHGGSLQLDYLGALFGAENQAVVGATFDFGDTRFHHDVQDASVDASRGVTPEEEDAPVPRTRLKATNDYYGLYFADTFSPFHWFHLTGSVRWNHAAIALDGSTVDDENETESLTGKHGYSRVNPAGGFTLQPLQALAMETPFKDLTLFANYSEGFRVPTPVELTCANPEEPCALPTNFVADPPLDPIVSRTYEAGLRDHFNHWLEWNLAFYRTDLSNDILFINAPGTLTRGYFQNVGDTRREGLELGLKAHTERFDAYANFSIVGATYRSAISLQNAVGPVEVQPGDNIPSIPQHLLKFGLDYEFLPGWRIGMDLQYASSQYLRGDDHNQLAKIPDYVVVNLNTSYRLNDHVELFALAKNVFDEDYSSFGLVNRNAFSDPVGRSEAFLSPGSGAAGWAGIRIRFI